MATGRGWGHAQKVTNDRILLSHCILTREQRGVKIDFTLKQAPHEPSVQFLPWYKIGCENRYKLTDGVTEKLTKQLTSYSNSQTSGQAIQ